MAQVDKKLMNKMKRKQKRDESFKALVEREKTRKRQCISVLSTIDQTVESEFAEENHNNSLSSDDDDDDDVIALMAKRPRPRNVINSQVAAALDRTKISDRNAVYALASFSQAVGQDTDALALNRWSVRRKRIKHRDEAIAKLKNSFTPDVPLVVHWDSKLLSDISGQPGKVDRLPIIVSGHGVERLLNVPKLPNGTGEAMANAVVQALNDWNLTDKVGAMSFDTTASNSGAAKGAAVLIEQKMAKDLLHLACRHHIFEVMLGDVLNLLAWPSSGPDIPIFKRFKDEWQSINHESDSIISGIVDEETAVFFSSNQELLTEVVQFANKCLLEENQPRDDYRELLELALIYMGHGPPRGVHLTKPGAMHRARWMAKAIYSLKIFCFRSQFHLTSRETNIL